MFSIVKPKMIKKYSLVIFLGFILWVIVNTVCHPILIDLVLQRDYPASIFTAYYFILYFLLGFLVGWPAKSKGWLLSLLLGVLIAGFFISTSMVFNFLDEEISVLGRNKTVLNLFRGNGILTLSMVIAGFLGGQINRKLSSRGT